MFSIFIILMIASVFVLGYYVMNRFGRFINAINRARQDEKEKLSDNNERTFDYRELERQMIEYGKMD